MGEPFVCPVWILPATQPASMGGGGIRTGRLFYTKELQTEIQMTKIYNSEQLHKLILFQSRYSVSLNLK
jgi:hypothetical protein